MKKPRPAKPRPKKPSSSTYNTAVMVATSYEQEKDSCSPKEQETPPSRIYIFSNKDELIAHASVQPKNETLLTFNTEPKETITVLVGPELERKDISKRLEDYRRYKPVSMQLQVLEKNHRIEMPLPSSRWLCWFLSRCVVPGTLYKNDQDGRDYPIANATVEVYEVDPIRVLIPKLPDSIIDKLKDIIVNPYPPIPPIPQPQPQPPIPPIPQPQPDPPPPFDSLPVDTFERFREMQKLPEYKELIISAKIQSKFEFRQTLIQHPRLVVPFLCIYFPRLVRMTKLTETTTNNCGNFTAVFFRGCNNTDKPDLYFVAKQQIPGSGEVTIYRKTPISCYTYWNYDCGTHVTLRSSHPDAIANLSCGTYSGDYVYFKAIGNTALDEIYGGGAAGTNGTNLGLKKGRNPGSPFAANLYLRADFSPSLRSKGVKYYRLSVREQGQVSASEVLNTEIKRYYLDDSTPGELLLNDYRLGPLAIGSAANGTDHLYEIPDEEAPDGSPWVSHPGSGNFYNSISIGMWNTTKELVTTSQPLKPEGKYELVMQLFDKDLNEIELDDFADKLYFVPNSNDSSEDPTQQRKANGLGLIKVGYNGKKAFVFTLHIDNNHCSGYIQAPKLNSPTADDCCGVLDYDKESDEVELPFTATHPNGYGDYVFRVVRGARQVLHVSEDVDYTATSDHPPKPSVFTLMNTNLPGDCATCLNAAFAEHLHVNAWATDGISRINAYDAHEVRAFALMKT